MHSLSSFTDVLTLADDAYQDQVLRGLETPNPEQANGDLASDQGLFALHLGAAFHRRAIMVDVMQFYKDRCGFRAPDFPSLALVAKATDETSSRDHARSCYAFSTSASPDLAESHYNLARLDRGELHGEAGLEGFRRVLELQPHERATPHAHLHANAHWESATILEDLGRNQEALPAYKSALAGLASFGVHHIRVAKFFRRMDCMAEALTEFRKGMGYSHRYFPEFLLPPLAIADPAAPVRLKPIHETARGETVVFWQGQYYALPAQTWQDIGEEVFELSEEQLRDARQSNNIAGLEASI